MRYARNLTDNSPVATMSGLVMWLDTTSERSFIASETKDGSSVSRWNNISPEASFLNYLGNNSATLSEHPIYKESCINGLPCLYFNGTAAKIFSPKSLGIRTKYMSAFFVFTGAENSNGSSYQIFNSDKNAAWDVNSGVFIFTGTAGQNFFYNMPANYGVQYNICNDAAKLAANKPYIYSVRDDYSNSIFHYVNGALANGTGGNGSIAKSFGTIEVGSASYKGNIGEIILFSRLLTMSEKGAIEQYLSKKWGITTAP